MTISQRGIELIYGFERFRSHPYLDAVGKPTIGYGTTVYPNGRAVKMSDPAIDKLTAQVYLRHYVDTQIAPHVTELTLNQNQYDAICSFCYNEGAGAIAAHTGIGKKLRENPSDPSIRQEFNRWIYADHKILQDLVMRRKAEADYYFSPAIKAQPLNGANATASHVENQTLTNPTANDNIPS